MTTPVASIALGAPEAILLVVVLAALGSFVVWVWALVDAVRISDATWTAAEQSKIVWMLLILFLHLLGTILYCVIARPSLKRARVATRV